MPDGSLNPRTYRAFTARDIDAIPQLRGLRPEALLRLRAVSRVLPFRVNEYVLDQLIDWSRVPDDPIYQLTIPQPEMLAEHDLEALLGQMRGGASEGELAARAHAIQLSMNPHPAGQLDLNVPIEQGVELRGLQHKYRETVLFFPAQGQTCHAYCTYCFRWAQFVGLEELKFAAREAEQLVAYLRRHPEVTDVLFTGGDPLVMRANVLRRYVEPLLRADLPNLVNIRFGTKSLAYWPYRFLSDPDADDVLRLFEEIQASGRHVAVMAHYSHPRELQTPAAVAALQRVRSTGAVIRCQAPVIRHVNDHPDIWSELWGLQVHHGAVPYYMFVERDTGPKEYFKVPLVRALQIYQGALRQISGLGRSARGPSMSATPGKIQLDGVTHLSGQFYFILRILQGRSPDWAGRIFLAEYDPSAAWISDLRPAFGADEFFYEEDLAELRRRRSRLRLSVVAGDAAAGRPATQLKG